MNNLYSQVTIMLLLLIHCAFSVPDEIEYTRGTYEVRMIKVNTTASPRGDSDGVMFKLMTSSMKIKLLFFQFGEMKIYVNIINN